MKNFDFIKACPQLNDLSTYCEEAETFALSYPRISAISARNALEFVINTPIRQNVAIYLRAPAFLS